jgi:hypothetical protein
LRGGGGATELAPEAALERMGAPPPGTKAEAVGFILNSLAMGLSLRGGFAADAAATPGIACNCFGVKTQKIFSRLSAKNFGELYDGVC